MTGPERAGVLRAVADILEQEADRLARLETTDNGKLLRETGGQMAAIPSWFRYFAGVAETARGETIPTAKAELPRLHRPRAGRRRRRDRALELAAAAARLEAGAGPGGRLHAWSSSPPTTPR